MFNTVREEIVDVGVYIELGREQWIGLIIELLIEGAL